MTVLGLKIHHRCGHSPAVICPKQNGMISIYDCLSPKKCKYYDGLDFGRVQCRLAKKGEDDA